MKIQVLTLFPELFDSFVSESIVARGIQAGLISIERFNLRAYSHLPHRQVDDTPYGGGAGMVLRADVMAPAIRDLRTRSPGTTVVALTPAGAPFTQQRAQQLAKLSSLTLVCGRYEGFDQRILDHEVDRQLSIGDYVVMGGEVPAMVVIEAVTRLVPGVVGNAASVAEESFSGADLEFPHYTRPQDFEGRRVPDVLLSGDHRKITIWRREQAQAITRRTRPDLVGS